MAGSVSLTGGLGTTIAWAPTFTEQLGIANAAEIGVAASTIGLIAACIIGGPIAGYLIKRHKTRRPAATTISTSVSPTTSSTAGGFLRRAVGLAVAQRRR